MISNFIEEVQDFEDYQYWIYKQFYDGNMSNLCQ